MNRIVAALSLVALGAIAALPAYALPKGCEKVKVLELTDRCLSPGGCRTANMFAYVVKFENSFEKMLHVSYTFWRPDGAIIGGGLSLDPKGFSNSPIGIGPVPLPKGETVIKTLARLRINECGTDKAIRWKWKMS